MIKLPPAEAALVRRAYLAITKEPWFNHNAVTERELLKMMIAKLPDLVDDEGSFLSACRAEARTRFSRRS